MGILYFPTICGTGTEDYVGGAYNWDVFGRYTTYSGPFMGMFQVVQPDGLYASGKGSLFTGGIRIRSGSTRRCG